ncbi:MAG: hypothetical protein R2837_04940 [Aliarcobacter sp.]
MFNFNQGWTQHTIGYLTKYKTWFNHAIISWKNLGKPGGGCNILRGHDNVQGSTDMGCLADTLPGYYGLKAEGSWKYFAKQWKVDYEWLKGRFKAPEMMQAKGNSLSLWIHNVVDDANAKNNAGTP